MSHVLPPFPIPDLGTQPLPERINMNDVKKLQNLYRDHCEVCATQRQLAANSALLWCGLVQQALPARAIDCSPQQVSCPSRRHCKFDEMMYGGSDILELVLEHILSYC